MRLRSPGSSSSLPDELVDDIDVARSNGFRDFRVRFDHLPTPYLHRRITLVKSDKRMLLRQLFWHPEDGVSNISLKIDFPEDPIENRGKVWWRDFLSDKELPVMMPDWTIPVSEPR